MPTADAVAGDTTAAGSSSSPSRTELHEHLQALCLDMARETLRSDNLDLFHESPQALYTHLADYFQSMKDRQTHEESIAVSAAGARFALAELYGQAHLSACGSNLTEKQALSAIQQSLPDVHDTPALDKLLARVTDTGAGPFASQRTVREQLQAKNVNVSALSEVLELCRLLDSTFGHTVPFGQVNVTHLAAMLVTLHPCDSLFQLIETLFDALPATKAPHSSGPNTNANGRPGSARGTAIYRAADLQKIRILHCWAAIDKFNASSLKEVQRCLLARPNLSLPLLADALPQVKRIGLDAAATSGEASAAAGASRPGTSSSGPVIASYTEDDVGGAPTSSVAAKSENDGDDGGSDSDGEGAADPAATAFWAALTAEAAPEST